ncbi:MAG: type II toxin-antitoxin system RelE/ParE family toxin [Candidatus Competibacteraceae bacterium]
MKRVFKTRHFSRWMRKTLLSNEALCKSVAEMELGLIDADLGGGVFKKLVALPGRGKRGSTRTLIVTNKSDRRFFVVGFEKNARANVSAEELR